MDNQSPRLRLSILGIVAFSLFGALFARLWYLQVMAAPEFKVEAQANRVRTVTEEAPRGRILDAKGRVIVDNRTSRVVTIDPVELRKHDAGRSRRARAAPGRDADELRGADQGQQHREQPHRQAVQPVAAHSRRDRRPEDLQVYLSEREDEFPAVDVDASVGTELSESRQARPPPTCSATSVASPRPSTTRSKGDRQDPSRTNPTARSARAVSRRRTRTSCAARRASGSSRSTPTTVPSAPSTTHHPSPATTSSSPSTSTCRQTTEKALREQLDAARGHRTTDGHINEGAGGLGGHLDPHNGNVVAMASYPTYDPDEFVNGISQARYNQLTMGAETDNPLINRAIAGPVRARFDVQAHHRDRRDGERAHHGEHLLQRHGLLRARDNQTVQQPAGPRAA